MEQNENQYLHEIEVLRNITHTCSELSARARALPLGEIVHRVLRRSPAKVSDDAIQYLAKYYLAHLADKTGHLARELQEFHSARVNPREVVVLASFFKNLLDEMKGVPHVRHYLTLAQYTS